AGGPAPPPPDHVPSSAPHRPPAGSAAPVLVGAPDTRPGSTIPASVAPFLARPVHDTPPPRSLCRSRMLHATLRYSSAEGMAAETITSCVGGTMLIAWAMYVGCGPVAIALLGALPYLAQLVQF